MLPLPLVLDLVKMWALQQTLKKLRQYAADDRPDVQFDMPIVGQKVDIWVRSEPTPPPTAPKAKRAMEITVEGEKFWLFYLFQKVRRK
jgi:hypothetical protein